MWVCYTYTMYDSILSLPFADEKSGNTISPLIDKTKVERFVKSIKSSLLIPVIKFPLRSNSVVFVGNPSGMAIKAWLLRSSGCEVLIESKIILDTYNAHHFTKIFMSPTNDKERLKICVRLMWEQYERLMCEHLREVDVWTHTRGCCENSMRGWCVNNYERLMC